MAEIDAKKIAIFSRFVLGDIVYLKIREEREPGMITGITVRPGTHIYHITWEDGCEATHYEIELTDTYEPKFENT